VEHHFRLVPLRIEMNDNLDREGSYYKSLTRKMVAIILVVSLTPLLLISAITRHYFQVSYREKVLDDIRARMEKQRQNIDNFLTDRLGSLRIQAKSFTFNQLMDEAALRERLAVLQEEYGRSFVDLGVIDDRGVQVAYAGPYQLHGADYSKADWYQKALLKDYYVSDVFKGLRNVPHLSLAVCRQHEGRNWVLRATVDFETFNALVENARLGLTGFAFILNREGQLQTTPSQNPPSKQPFVDFLVSGGQTGQGVEYVETESGSGQRLLSFMSRLNGGQWVLVLTQPMDEAYSDLFHARNLSITVLILGSLSIACVAVILSRRIVKRIAQVVGEKQMINEQLIEAGKLASLGEMAAGIAHEINNPVGIMINEAGWMQDLLDDEDLGDNEQMLEFKQGVQKILTQGRRCKEITLKLLSFARKTDPAVKVAQLNELITEIIDLSQQRARYSNVKLSSTLAANLPTVNVSPSEIQQILLNMVNNSLDALGNKGGNINIQTRVEGRYAVVDISDDGEGIPRGNLLRIFEPFFTTKPVGKGTGLGLSICYGIIKRLGGDILVDSDLGAGTTFHILIPLPSSGST